MIVLEVFLEFILFFYAAYLFVAASRCNGCVIETWRLMFLMAIMTYLVGSVVCELHWHISGQDSPIHQMDPAAWQVLDLLDLVIIALSLHFMKESFFRKCRWKETLEA